MSQLDVPTEEDYEVVIPTAPEDEFDQSHQIAQKPKLGGCKSGIKGQEPVGSGKGQARGLPSHAFSRNYYCRFCSFNTTKSKVHLYHLVDVHGVDYKIFSCDRCDYASRWKCKVIRHRKMIHKINEPKFEPTMHDRRNLVAGFPKPASTSVTTSPQAASSMCSISQKSTPTKQYVEASTVKAPTLFQVAHGITAPSHPKPAELVAVSIPSSNTSRSRRKPQQVRKVIRPSFDDVAVYAMNGHTEDTDALEMVDNMESPRPGSHESAICSESEAKNCLDEPAGLFGIGDFGKGDSGVFGGAWRKRLMPTPVQHVAHNCDRSSNISLTKEMNSLPMTQEASDSQKEAAPIKHEVAAQQEDELSQEDQLAMVKDRLVEEMMIDDEVHYRCSECNFISKFRWKTTKHYKANHINSKTFKCTICHFSTLNRVEFFSHKATHSTRGIHRCVECSYIASNKTNLDRHMVNHRMNNPVKCLYCSFSSTGEAAIQRHMAEHHDQSELPLSMRRRTLSDQEDSQDEGHSTGCEITCAFCDYTARSSSKMKEHMIRHSEGTPFACSFCNSKYKRPADLNRHLKLRHNTCLADIGLDGPTLKDNVVPGTGDSSMEESCSDDNMPPLKRGFQSREYRSGSLDLDSASDDEPKRLCIDEEAENLRCKKCAYIAKWPGDLDRHVKQVHSATKRFNCAVCSKSYKYHGDLNVHMRKVHAVVNTRLHPTKLSSRARTPPPNVQVVSNEVIVNMSHAAIVNPMANLGRSRSPQPDRVSSTRTPQMPTLKLAPNLIQTPNSQHKDDSPGPKKIKKGELDPATMVHVPGGEFKCLNCCYESNFKSHLDAHMRLHPQKPFQCMFCSYASYWRGDTKKHLEKNHPEQLDEGVNPYNLVERAFEDAVSVSTNRDNPLPEIHNVPPKYIASEHPPDKSDRGVIWTPPVDTISLSPTAPPEPVNTDHDMTDGDEPVPLQCPHCPYNTLSEARWNAHIATHFNYKVFKCPACGKRANFKWDIQKHIKTSHPDCLDEVICLDQDEAKNSLDDYLRNHPEQRAKPRDMTSASKAVSIRPFRCSVCGRRSNWKCDIRKHYRQVHPDRMDAHVILMTREELLEAGEKEEDVDSNYPESKSKGNQNVFKPFRCSVCGKNSRWKWDVTKHIKMVHKGLVEAVVLEDEDPDAAKDAMSAEVDTSLEEEGGDNSVVSHSPQSVSEPTTPKEQLKSSSNPKIGCYQCSVCGQFSEFMWVIRRHIRSQHPDASDACIVDMTGKEDSAANDSRPYLCSLCGKRSNWKWDVKKHILSVHRGQIGSILDEFLNKETVIYCDGKTMDINSNAQDKIAEVKTHLKETGADEDDMSIPESAPSNDICYSSLPTQVGLQSAVAPEAPPDIKTQQTAENGSLSSGKECSNLPVKFKCGYCFYVSTSRNETVRHVRSEHAGKILRIQTLNRTGKDEQTMYKAAHRASVVATGSAWCCGQCDYRNGSKEEALEHIQTHGLYNAYHCAICDYADDMEYTLHKHIKNKHVVESVADYLIQNIVFQPRSEDRESSLGLTYSCNLCEMKTAWRSAIIRHIKEKHPMEGDIQGMFTKYGTQKETSTEPARRYNCPLCPYKTDKVSMFNEHSFRHQKRQGNEIKCAHCDYWVAHPRLLHQHLRLHQQNGVQVDFSEIDAIAVNPGRERYSMSGGLAQCPDCPYRGKTKDLNHHRRLHKQRPGCVYKCEHCNYWVSHGRLLQQHMKVHSPSYRAHDFHSPSNEPAPEEVAAFKQQIIDSKVESVKLEPSVLGLRRKMRLCGKCPFATTRLQKLRSHEEMHGTESTGVEGAIQCKFCDFYSADREVMRQHVKVHSLQYQGEADDSDDGIERNGEDDAQHTDDMSINGALVEQAVGFSLKFNENTQDIILEKQKNGGSLRFCCERCPYATRQKEYFQMHTKLHGSKLGSTCEFCDYSVPTPELLSFHTELHKRPNRNLLAAQSITNLTKLPPVPADIHLLQSVELNDVTITDVHDHMALYENRPISDRDNITPAARSSQNEGEPEFIDIADLEGKVTSPSNSSSSDEEIEREHLDKIYPSLSALDGDEDDADEGDTMWICQFCDRAFDAESELLHHEKQHPA